MARTANYSRKEAKREPKAPALSPTPSRKGSRQSFWTRIGAAW